MNSKITTIIFDYGGTLDTNGVHWSEKFWEAYQYFNIPISKEEFKNSYQYSEQNAQMIITPDSSLVETYVSQLYFQIKYLEKKNLLSGAFNSIIDELAEYCHRSVTNNIKKSKIIIEGLLNKYSLLVVSNYYGNLSTVLNEIGLKNYFTSIIDSKVVRIRKPDPKIFSLALNSVNSHPYETIVVGDSYTNDILPSKQIGCKTVWLKNKNWEIPTSTESADAIINSLDEIEETINRISNINRGEKNE
ncbi:MAG: HAD family hydrolase [Bacteroidota bacterium]